MTARATDPATSHLAATYISGKRPGLKDAFLMALKALGPSTANEIAQWCVQAGVSANAESVRKRAGDLVNDGLCEWSDVRACKITTLNARTVRISNADPSNAQNTNEHAKADRRAGNADHRVAGQTHSDCKTVRSQQVAGKQNQSGQESVQSLEAERVKAVVEFVRHEFQPRFIPDVANEMTRLAKMGTWPAGDNNDYIKAIESAALSGLIERSGSNVKAKRVVKETKVVQKELFGD